MEIATVDLRCVEPGGPGWEAARAAVTASMVAHGFVIVAHDALGPDLQRLPESVALPTSCGRTAIRSCGETTR